MSMNPGDTIKVAWGGLTREARVIRVYKNGKIRVQFGRDRWTGGRPGTSSAALQATVESWQVRP